MLSIEQDKIKKRLEYLDQLRMQRGTSLPNIPTARPITPTQGISDLNIIPEQPKQTDTQRRLALLDNLRTETKAIEPMQVKPSGFIEGFLGKGLPSPPQITPSKDVIAVEEKKEPMLPDVVKRMAMLDEIRRQRTTQEQEPTLEPQEAPRATLANIWSLPADTDMREVLKNAKETFGTGVGTIAKFPSNISDAGQYILQTLSDLPNPPSPLKGGLEWKQWEDDFSKKFTEDMLLPLTTATLKSYADVFIHPARSFREDPIGTTMLFVGTGSAALGGALKGAKGIGMLKSIKGTALANKIEVAASYLLSPSTIFGKYPAGVKGFDAVDHADLTITKFAHGVEEKLSQNLKGISQATLKEIDAPLAKLRNSKVSIEEALKMTPAQAKKLKFSLTKEELNVIKKNPIAIKKFNGFLSKDLDDGLRLYGDEKVGVAKRKELWNKFIGEEPEIGVVPKETVPKKPWEMTRGEYSKVHFKPGVMTKDGKFIVGWDHGDALNRAEDLGYTFNRQQLGQASGWRYKNEIVLDKDLVDASEIGIRKFIIERAIKEGNSVPKEVLGEFPDLYKLSQQKSIIPPIPIGKTPLTKESIRGLTPAEADVAQLYSRRIDDYLHHHFDRDTLIESMKSRIKTKETKLKSPGLNPGQYSKLQTSIAEDTEFLNKLNNWQPYLTNELPTDIQFKAFMKRTKDMSGFEMSALKSYRTYMYGLGRELYVKPAIQEAVTQFKNLPSHIQGYANWWLRDYLGYNKSPSDKFFSTIKSLVWSKTLGFNPNSSIVNAFQKTNTIADVGPIWSVRGWNWGMSSEGRAAFANSGLSLTTPSVMMEGATTPAKWAEQLRRASGYLFSKVEEGNLRHAFSSYYVQALSKGASKEASMLIGIKGARKTQFRYGKIDMPRMLRGAGGAILQFWSYPIKQTEFLTKLMRENPAKFMGWLTLSEGLKTTFQEFLGLDLSNALGMGIDYGELLSGLHDLEDKDFVGAEYHKQQLGMGGGIMPYGFGPIVQIANQLGKKVFGESFDPTSIYEEIEPTIVKKGRQAYSAFTEGQEEGKYNIRNPYTGELLYRETLPQVISRTVVAKPMVETRAQKEVSSMVIADKLTQKLKRQISQFLAKGDTEKALILINKLLKLGYPIEASDEMIRAEMGKKVLTKEERARLNIPTSSQVMEYLLRNKEKK